MLVNFFTQDYRCPDLVGENKNIVTEKRLTSLRVVVNGQLFREHVFYTLTLFL